MKNISQKNWGLETESDKKIVAKLMQTKSIIQSRKFGDFLRNLPKLSVDDRRDFVEIIKECRSHSQKK